MAENKIKYEDLFAQNLDIQIKALTDALTAVRAEIEKLKTTKPIKIAAENSGKEAIELANAIEQVTTKKKAYLDLSKSEEKILKEIEAAKKRHYEQDVKQALIDKEQNDLLKKEILSIEELEKKQALLVKQRKQITQLDKESIANFQKLTKEISENQKKLNDYNESIKRYQGNVGNYFEKGKQALSSFGKELLLTFGAFQGVQSVITGMKELYTRTTENSKISKQLSKDYKVVGDDLTNLTIKVRQISKAFDVDYNEVLIAARSVSKEFGIDGEKSLSLIRKGFDEGSNASGEFLEMLREYPAQLATVGLSADESFALINQQVTEGIYSDKGVDSIKEAGLRLREMTPATLAALKAIGLSGKDIQKELQNGTKTTFQVIQEVSKKLSTFQEDSKETGQVLADVFGGAGEDAGYRYITMLGNASTETNKFKGETNELLDSQTKLSDSWENFINKVANGEGIFAKVTASFLTGLSDIIDGFDKLSTSKSVTSFLANLASLTGNTVASEQITSLESAFNDPNRFLTGKVSTGSKLQSTIKDNDLQKAITGGGSIIKPETIIPEVKAIEDKEINNFKTKEEKKTTALEEAEKKRLEIQMDYLARFDKTKEKSVKSSVTDINQIYIDAEKTKQDELFELQSKEIENNTVLMEEILSKELELVRLQYEQKEISQAEYEFRINESEKRMADFKEAEEQRKLSIIANSLGATASLFKQNTIAYKALASAQAFVDTYAAANAALNSGSKKDPIYGFLAAATAIVTGLANVAKINAVKFEKGGWIKGKSHKEGGEIIEAEGNEFMVSKRFAPQAATSLEMINKGLLTDKDILTNSNGVNILQTKQLEDKLNRQIEAQNKTNEYLRNLGYAYQSGKYIFIKHADGSIEKHLTI